METLYRIILITHIFCGAIALLTGLLAILFRHKVKIHKPIGKIYFWAMTIIFFSAIFLSVYKSNIFFVGGVLYKGSECFNKEINPKT